MEKINYWGFRIDTSNRSYFYDEMLKGNLRQGWGYNVSQNLKSDKVDTSARRNLPIYNKVKKGDILLVPHIAEWDEIAIVEAVEDFDKGYKFEIDPQIGDYGHIFPARFLRCFSRNNINVDADIRETFKCRSRFWNINRCEEQIKKILEMPITELKTSSSYRERIRKTVESSFENDIFSQKVYTKLNNLNQASEWEFVLCEGLRMICPDSYSIYTTSNKDEKKHGADIIIRIPGLLDNTYIIAIQVKDFINEVDKKVIKQICKADEYFEKEEGSILIDKYIFITRTEKDVNEELFEEAKMAGVKILFGRDIQKLLSKIGIAFLIDNINE